MKTLKVNPEFGIELALAVPYAYWLHTQGKLEKVITSNGMKPFYYFCDDVREEFTGRTIDNSAAGLNELPNNWIHHNSLKVFGKEYNDLEDTSVANGVLDYSQWTPPPYKEHYKNDVFDFGKPIVFISNKFNLEHGQPPTGYFDIECLHQMFDMFTKKGYSVVYKRVDNRDSRFTVDQNESDSIRMGYGDIQAKIESTNEIISDWDLTNYFKDVYLFNDLVEKYPKYSFNEVQLMIMANSSKFVTVCGGNSILSSYFGGNVLSYIHKGAEIRPNYFGENSYFRKLSNANVIPIYDIMDETQRDYAKKHGYKINDTGKNDYTELLNTIGDKW